MILPQEEFFLSGNGPFYEDVISHHITLQSFVNSLRKLIRERMKPFNLIKFKSNA